MAYLNANIPTVYAQIRKEYLLNYDLEKYLNGRIDFLSRYCQEPIILLRKKLLNELNNLKS